MLAAHILASLSFRYLVNIGILLSESCGMITGNPSPGKQFVCLFRFYYIETQCTGIQSLWPSSVGLQNCLCGTHMAEILLNPAKAHQRD